MMHSRVFVIQGCFNIVSNVPQRHRVDGFFTGIANFCYIRLSGFSTI